MPALEPDAPGTAEAGLEGDQVAVENDIRLPLRACRYHADTHAGLLLYPAQVGHRILGKLSRVSHAPRGFFPAGEVIIDRLALGEYVDLWRQLQEPLAVVLVGDADLLSSWLFPPKYRSASHQSILDEILEERVVSSPGRRNPRAVKRNTGKYPIRHRCRHSLSRIDAENPVKVLR